MEELLNIHMMVDKTHQLLGTLGVGGAGEVYSIRNIKNNCVFAAKFARKDLNVTQSKKLMLLQRERDIMQELNNHPNILKSYHLYKKRKSSPMLSWVDFKSKEIEAHLSTSPYHLIEYCENGCFVNYLRKQSAVPESIAVFYADQLLSAIHYIHQEGYAHLDIKLDNILLDDYFNIRLSDFGSALKIDESNLTCFRRGTPKYMAPEVFNLKTGECFNPQKADIYSFGVWIFLMLFKKFPHQNGNDYPLTQDLVLNPEKLWICPFDLEYDQWNRLTYETRLLLVSCLNQNPVLRPSSQDILSNFTLPVLPEWIGDVIMEEMQLRRSKYEQSINEPQNWAQLLWQPQPCIEVPQICIKGEGVHRVDPQVNGCGSSTNASTNSKI